MLPARQEAEALLAEAERCNPGPWGAHSRVAARCAEAIAAACPELNGEKAYILALLHGIGRKFGTGHLRHVWDGYTYLTALGYDEAARICLTHSFHDLSLRSYIGRFDLAPEEQRALTQALSRTVLDDYDRLCQLCDALASAEGVVDVEVRMADVKRRYGSYPQEKWDANLALKAYFGKKAGRSMADLLREV